MVEIIPKTPKKQLPIINIFIFIAGALVVAVIFAYVILINLEVKTASAIQDLEENISKVGAVEDKEIEEEVFNYEDKIKDFQVLWGGRRKFSKFFDNFGTLIHPQVWFSSFNIDPVNIAVTLSGSAASFSAVEQQVIFLQKSNLVESVNLSDVSLGDDGGVDFSFSLVLTPKIFNILGE